MLDQFITNKIFNKLGSDGNNLSVGVTVLISNLVDKLLAGTITNFLFSLFGVLTFLYLWSLRVHIIA